jgi:hypothetical protein
MMVERLEVIVRTQSMKLQKTLSEGLMTKIASHFYLSFDQIVSPLNKLLIGLISITKMFGKTLPTDKQR